MQERPYDIIVWGASRLYRPDRGGLYAPGIRQRQFALGRCRTQPRQAREWWVNGRDIPVLNADSHDTRVTRQLVQQTKVILTTVGPYARYGSKLVAACAEHGTDYCDLTGESLWMREMINAHQQAAKDSGARIVHTCGFDSIPSDIGVFFSAKRNATPPRRCRPAH